MQYDSGRVEKHNSARSDSKYIGEKPNGNAVLLFPSSKQEHVAVCLES